jgi:hypothetical protein
MSNIEDLAQFKLTIKHFGEVIVPKNHTEICCKIAKILHNKVTAAPMNGGTPLDTGWAAANWGLCIGRKGVPKKPMGKYPEDAAGLHIRPIPLNAYFPNIDAVLATAGIAPFIWVFNNVPYIQALEDGHSKSQAPNGMVLNALNDIKEYANLL